MYSFPVASSPQTFMLVTNWSYLFGVHADRHLAVQVAFSDHVRAAGVDYSGWFQRLDKSPADCLVAISSCHLLNTGQRRCRVGI